MNRRAFLSVVATIAVGAVYRSVNPIVHLKAWTEIMVTGSERGADGHLYETKRAGRQHWTINGQEVSMQAWMRAGRRQGIAC